jgi:hypothetical protein
MNIYTTATFTSIRNSGTTISRNRAGNESAVDYFEKLADKDSVWEILRPEGGVHRSRSASQLLTVLSDAFRGGSLDEASHTAKTMPQKWPALYVDAGHILSAEDTDSPSASRLGFTLNSIGSRVTSCQCI